MLMMTSQILKFEVSQKHKNLDILSMVAEMLQKEFLCDIKKYFYSIKINLYSIKYIYVISKYVFIQSINFYLIKFIYMISKYIFIQTKQICI